jgi:hypothetical protein
LKALKNIEQLRVLLTISDDKTETIYGVMERMRMLLIIFEKEPKYRGLSPFLQTYYFVTREAAGRYEQKENSFSHTRDHELLDVYFASLYFKPLLAFLEKGECLSPWKSYFAYCQNPRGIPFLQVLLGINAHINTDLYSALVACEYKHKIDYDVMNDVLLEVMPKVMWFLAIKRRDFIGMGGIVMPSFMKYEFCLIIEKWRRDVWHNALATNEKNKKGYYAQISKETEEIGIALTKRFTDLYRLRGMITILSAINNLSVTLK